MPWPLSSLERIVLEKANTFAHLPNSVRPTVICVLRLGAGMHGQCFTGESSSMDRALHPTVARIYGEIPDVYRSVNSGGCAEADALSKALYTGMTLEDLRGAESQAVITRTRALVPPCQSCLQVLRRLRIRHVGNVNFNPVLAEILARGA